MALLWSGLFVLLVAVGRTPLVELIAGRGYLYTALVAHVVFALDVWLLSASAGLWVIGAARLGRPLPAGAARAGLVLAWAGTTLLVVVPLAGVGEPVMADYVPILVHPLFLLGLAAFFAGIAVVAVAFLVTVRAGARSLAGMPLALGAAGYLVALAAFGLAAVRWGTADYATLVWGGGHLFQLVQASSLVALWLMMVPIAGWLPRGLVAAGFVGFVLAPPLVVASYLPSLGWNAVALSFWTALGVPLGVTWLAVTGTLLIGWWRERCWPPVGPFLPFTLALFVIGGLIALPGSGYDTRLTAHYHATVGAVTMGFMALAYALAVELGRPVAWPRLARLQPYLYGVGLLCLVGGLYWAGEAGTTRKIFEAITSKPALLPAATLFGLGALATVAGGIIFVAGLGWVPLGDAPAGHMAADGVPIKPAPLPPCLAEPAGDLSSAPLGIRARGLPRSRSAGQRRPHLRLLLDHHGHRPAAPRQDGATLERPRTWLAHRRKSSPACRERPRAARMAATASSGHRSTMIESPSQSLTCGRIPRTSRVARATASSLSAAWPLSSTRWRAVPIA
jgi:hypothetical protein